MQALQLLECEPISCGERGFTISQEDGSKSGRRQAINAVGERLSVGFIRAAANAVAQAVQGPWTQWLGLLGGRAWRTLFCGADWQVINGIKREGVGGEGVATSAIGDDVVESDDAIDVRVWREGVGAITVVGNEAASC